MLGGNPHYNNNFQTTKQVDHERAKLCGARSFIFKERLHSSSTTCKYLDNYLHRQKRWITATHKNKVQCLNHLLVVCAVILSFILSSVPELAMSSLSLWRSETNSGGMVYQQSLAFNVLPVGLGLYFKNHPSNQSHAPTYESVAIYQVQLYN